MIDAIKEVSREMVSRAISEQEYISLHQQHVRLWTWLSEHPNKRKPNYFEELGLVENIPIDYCYACEVACKMSDELRVCSNIVREYFWYYGARCYYCPFVGDVDREICCPAYDKWRFSHSAFYAKQIARAPWWSYSQYLDSLVRAWEWIKYFKGGNINE